MFAVCGFKQKYLSWSEDEAAAAEKSTAYIYLRLHSTHTPELYGLRKIKDIFAATETRGILVKKEINRSNHKNSKK